MKMNINKKVLLGYTLVILISTVFVIQFVFSQLDIVVNQSLTGVENIRKSQGAVQTFEWGVRDLQKEIRDLRHNRDAARLTAVKERLTQLRTQLTILRTTTDAPAIAFQQLEQALDRGILALETVLLQLENVAPDTDAGWHAATLDAAVDDLEITASMKSIHNSFQNEMGAVRAGIYDIWQNSLYSMLIALGASVVLAVLIGIVISRNITGHIRRNSDQIQGVSSKLLDMTEQESELSEKQAEAISATTETLENLTAFSNQISANTKTMSTQVTEASERFRQLQQLAQKVNKFNTVIEEISQQINILSLNASIEASRAGEQGKGFSAVALEIRKLAESAKKSTSGIRSFTDEIDQGVAVADSAITKMVALVEEIAAQITRQDAGTSQISHGMADVDAGMKITVERIQETRRSAEQLHELADNLQELI